jgi:hypothetical protein
MPRLHLRRQTRDIRDREAEAPERSCGLKEGESIDPPRLLCLGGERRGEERDEASHERTSKVHVA